MMNSKQRSLVSNGSLSVAMAIAMQGIVYGQTPETNSYPFRPRTDPSAEQDTQKLREALNKLHDSRGPINPLADYLNRSADSAKDVATDSKDDDTDLEAQQKPKLDLKTMPSTPARSSTPTSRSSKGIVLLPGPQFTIVQNPNNNVPIAGLASRDGFSSFPIVVDDSLNPVTFASANVPIGAGNNVTANYQLGPEVPNGLVPTVNGGLPPANILPNNPGPINYPLPTNAPPTFAQPSVQPGADPAAVMPPTLAPQPNIGPTFVPPPNAPTYSPQPTYLAPAPPPYYAPNNGVGGGSPLSNGQVMPPNNGMPNYNRQPGMVNDLPFVSKAPCQFDARYMVSPTVYRQSLDPCADPCAPGARGGANSYAPSPYATSPSGSPFAYVPPTYMPGMIRPAPYPGLRIFGQSLDRAYLSRGIIGQPTAYVDGQPLRNFIRYLSP